jgi:antitoxin YefM
LRSIARAVFKRPPAALKKVLFNRTEIPYKLFTSSSLAIMSFTETISYTEARDRFADVLDTVEATRDAIVITRRGHANVVLIAEDELSSLQETAHLFRSPANARRLLESLARSIAGQGTEMTVDELTRKSGISHTNR